MRYCIVLLLFISHFVSAQTNQIYERTKESVWVDSTYANMSFDERVGQLFMVSAFSNKDSLHVKSIDNLIKCHYIGGLLFFQGSLGPTGEIDKSVSKRIKNPFVYRN